MDICKHIALLAHYNQWMNAKLFETAGRLGTEEVAAERGAFFGSILGTLNHIAVADTIWLSRFATHPSRFASLSAVGELPAPTALDTLLFERLDELWDYRQRLDHLILRWAAELMPDDLSCPFNYASMKGIAQNKCFGSVVMHFFNHQTHHRGQATTLLFQAGQDVGVTDFITLVPDEVTM